MNRIDCCILTLISILIVICIYLLYDATNNNERYFWQIKETESNQPKTNEVRKDENRAPGIMNCPPFTMIDPIEFTNFLYKNGVLNQKEFNEVNSKFLPKLPNTDIIKEKVNRYMNLKNEKNVNIETNLKNNSKTQEIISYILNLLPYFPLELWDKIFFSIVNNPNLTDAIVNFFKPTCKKMNRNQAVGIIFVESSLRDGPKFSADEKRELKNSINKALNTLKTNHPTGNLNWKTSFEYIQIDAENGELVELTAGIRDKFGYETYWTGPALSKLRYNNKSFANTDEYLNELKTVLGCDFASLYFITPYNTSYPAYASFSKQTVVISNNHDYINWGLDQVWKVMMHECCHLFGAPDEYVTTGGGTSCTSCSSITGCNKVVNGNCQLCVDEQVSKKCVMIKNEAVFCVYTQAQIGWIDTYLKVRVITSRDRWSGTDNPIKIKFYRGRSNNQVIYDLNTDNYNDFEMGDDDFYILPVYNSADPIRDFSKFTISIEPVIGIIDSFKINKIQIYKNEDLVSDLTPNVWLTYDRKSWNSF